MYLSEHIAHLENDVQELAVKSESDDSLIALLKRQNENQRAEMEAMRVQHADRIRELTQRADVAERKAKEVSGIIESMCKLGVTGIRKMRGDEEPHPQTQVAIDPRGHIQGIASGGGELPPNVKPMQRSAEKLPVPELAVSDAQTIDKILSEMPDRYGRR